jgi:hypothetical protein
MLSNNGSISLVLQGNEVFHFSLALVDEAGL